MGAPGRREHASSARRVGRSVWGQGKGFCEGTGPDVFMAEWWVREHWGRAFDIAFIVDAGMPMPPVTEVHGRGQGVVVMRPNGRACTAAEIEALRWQFFRAQAELDAIHTSRSWRLTAPMSAVRGRLRR